MSKATVVGVISMGNQDYCFLSEYNTNNIYQTSPYSAGELTTNQIVQLRYTRTDNQVSVLAETLTEFLYAYRVVNNGSNFYPNIKRMPKLVGEILFFDDRDHLNEAYDMVELFLNDTLYDKDMDQKLDEIEFNDYPGYASYRTFFNTKYKWLDGEFTDRQLEDIYAEEYIYDEIYKTFINNNALIGIGDSIFYYHNEDVIVAIQKDNADGLVVLKDLWQDNQVEDVNIFNPALEIWGDDSGFALLVENKQVTTYSSKANVISPTGYFFQSIPHKGGTADCDPYSVNLSLELNRGVVGSAGSYEDFYQYGIMITLTINWGDGTNEVIYGYLGETIDHVYSNTQLYHPTTSLQFFDNSYLITLNDGNGSVNTSTNGLTTSGFDITFNTLFSCGTNDASQQYWEVVSDRKMATKTWIKHNTIIKRIGGYTHSWKQKANGNWVRKRADISIQVHGVFRDGSCNVIETKDGFKHNGNDRKIQKSVSKWWQNYAVGEEDVWTKHNLYKNSISIWKHSTVNPCQ